jgi:hypothetical protein
MATRGWRWQFATAVPLLLGMLSARAEAQLAPGVQFSLAGVSLWQDLGGGLSANVNCIRGEEHNARKGPICKQFPKFEGTLDLCEGKVQSIDVLSDEADLGHIDRAFNQAVGLTEREFGQPSFLGVTEAHWDLGDIQIMVHEVSTGTPDWMAVFVDEFSRRSRRPEFGCRADNSGELGKVVQR